MITVRTKPYSKADIKYLSEVFREGLERNCWAYKDGLFDSEVCESCEHRLSCRACHSALLFLESKYYKPEKGFLKN